MMLRKPTESGRATVSQELRTLLGPELGVDASACRRITLMTPASPQVNFALTPYTLKGVEGELTVLRRPEDFGLNQSYKAAPLPLSNSIRFEITAEQSIIASADEGIAKLSVIVEYL